MPEQNGGSRKEGATDVPEGVSGGLFGGVFTRGGPVADDAAWLRAMLAVEAGLVRALEHAGLAPAGAGAAVTAAAARAGDFDIAELSLSSALTGNPVPGLARALTRLVDDPAARAAVHQGATSQDIMDSAAMLLARDAIDAALADLSRAAAAAARLADAHRGSLMIGRTLLQQAVPVTFGVVAAGWLAGLDAAIGGLVSVRDTRPAELGGGHAGLARRRRPPGEGAVRPRAQPGRPAAALAYRAAADHRHRHRDGSGHRHTREGGPRRHAARADRGGGGLRGHGNLGDRRVKLGAAPWRLVRHAEQEQPGRGRRHPRLRQAGAR